MQLKTRKMFILALKGKYEHFSFSQDHDFRIPRGRFGLAFKGNREIMNFKI